MSLIAYIRDVEGQEIFEYPKLSPIAKQKALEAVAYAEGLAVKRDIERAKKTDLNARINDPYHISGILYGCKLVAKFRNKYRIAESEKIIVSNLMHFLADGTYITYFPRRDV